MIEPIAFLRILSGRRPVARFSAAGYVHVAALEATINSPHIDYSPFVSLDGRYLMFSSSRPSAEEHMFLYISFKGKDGTWSVPRKMNDALGFTDHARFPSISPDEKYLFFCGDDGNIYWADVSVIEKLSRRQNEFRLGARSMANNLPLDPAPFTEPPSGGPDH